MHFFKISSKGEAGLINFDVRSQDIHQNLKQENAESMRNRRTGKKRYCENGL